MRHLGSILLSLVLATFIWVSTGIGLSKFAEGLAEDPDYLAAFVGMLALGVAGLLYSVLMLARLSPLGPVLAGLAYLGVTMWALTSPDSVRDVLPSDVVGVAGAGMLPVGGFAALLAVPLLATIVSPRRWRRRDRIDPATQPTVYGAPSNTPATTSYPSYPSPLPPPSYPPPSTSAEDTRPLPPGG